MAELVINPGTLSQLEKMANAQGSTTEELAEQALRQFLRDEKRRLMRRESVAFQSMHAELLAKHLAEYVAIYQGQLVDYDVDQSALVTRIDTQYPDVPVLIKQVLPDPNETYTIRSPRFENEWQSVHLQL